MVVPRKLSSQRRREGPGLYYDPLYKYIPLPPIIRDALDLPSMQRLRRLKQLSALELVFPGATHNRLEHSVGVYYIATLIFDTILARREYQNEEWPELSPNHRLAVQLAALFHDIGHGPYSHVFEMFRRRNPIFGEYTHGFNTERLIRDGLPEGDVAVFLTNIYNQKKGESYAEFLLPENIAALVVGKPPKDFRYGFLSQIISWQFDADRMDYLLRDSLHIGVGNGDLDIWSIVNRFVLAEEEKGTGLWAIKIEPEAAEAAENFLVVRDLAYRRVYFHETHRAAQQMLIRAMNALSATEESKLSVSELSYMTDDELMGKFSFGSAFTKRIVERIKNRDLYEPLPIHINIRIDLEDKSRTRIAELADARPLNISQHKEWLDLEKKAAENIGLPPEETVIFDLERTPISSQAEYTKKDFYNKFAPEPDRAITIMQLMTHLEMTHRRSANSEEDTYKRLSEEISRLFIFLPYEHVTSSINRMIDEASASDFADSSRFEELVENVYSLSFDPIIVVFLKLIAADGNSTLKDKLKKQVMTYVKSLLGIKF